jgi:hypothetical protein
MHERALLLPFQSGRRSCIVAAHQPLPLRGKEHIKDVPFHENVFPQLHPGHAFCYRGHSQITQRVQLALYFYRNDVFRSLYVLLHRHHVSLKLLFYLVALFCVSAILRCTDKVVLGVYPPY